MPKAIPAVALTVALLGCRERDAGLDARAAAVGSGAVATPHTSMYASGPVSFVDLVANARRGVVAIRSVTPVKSGPAAMFPGTPEVTADTALGTGFLIEANGVFVVTNDHIAAASTELHVVLSDGTEVAAKVLGRDPRLDIALLQIDLPRLQPLPIGNSDELRVGEWLVVLGDAFGDEVSATAGIVSATGRETASFMAPGRANGFRTFLQTDARIHRGNSGGPVLDTAGQVVGVAVATGDRAGEISYAIPINRVREIVAALRDYGQVARGWLGTLVKPVTAELAASLGLPNPTGALVTEIKVGSPAARSGLRPGDVILKWGERDVDHRSLPWVVASTPVGKPTSVSVWRNHAQTDIAVVTEKMPE